MRIAQVCFAFIVAFFAITNTQMCRAFNEEDLAHLKAYNSCPDCDLTKANLSWLDLREANLGGADLRKAQLIRTNLRKTNLAEANLTGANLLAASLVGAELTNTNFYKKKSPFYSLKMFPKNHHFTH